jgi:hypothetical protein
VAADGDLGPVPRLAGDVGDLHDALGDLGHLQLEQPLDEVRMRPRDHHPQAPGRPDDVGHVHLEPVVVLVVLARHLLGVGQVGLDLAQVDRDVALVTLLHDAGHDVADSALVLAEGDVAFGLAQALHDDLLGRDGGDPPEVGGVSSHSRMTCSSSSSSWANTVTSPVPRSTTTRAPSGAFGWRL